MFECPKCGSQFPKWQGRCNECGNWGLVEAENKEEIKTIGKNINTSGKVSALVDLNLVDSKSIQRIKTGIKEVDLVFGGGVVPGSFTLLSGQPGIGKSTILTQISLEVSNSIKGEEFVLYVSGEETAEQIKSRFDRMSIKDGINNLKFSGDTIVENIIQTSEKYLPKLLVIDSIQTIYSKELENSVGSMNQIKACTAKLLELSKNFNIPVIIVGHITKDGGISGPKMLEHMVDVVLYFEAQKYKNFRTLRAIKNRFGNTNEVGIFEMKEDGLKEIENPLQIFMDKDQKTKGNIITCVKEGTRPFLVEVQALVSKTAFGYPKRTVSGFSLNRLEVIIAVLTKKAALELFNYDIYINVVGGINPKDTAIDLAVATSIISAYLNKVITTNICVFGEIGLTGEVRAVTDIESRIKEVRKMKFDKILIPKNNIEDKMKDKDIIEIENIKDVISIFQK